MIPHFGLDRQYQTLKNELLEVTDQVLKSGQYVSGYFTDRFESWLKYKTDSRYATVTHSGTQALEIVATYEFSIQDPKGPKPKIRIPNLTYPATLNAFLSTGWDIELIDTDKNGIINIVDFDDYAVHTCFVGLYGAVPNFKLHGDVIIDGAQHWLAPSPIPGIATAISFDPTKNLSATGNGGAIVTNDSHLYDFIEEFKNNGKPLHRHCGTNSKMSELDCAHLLVRANYINYWQERRKQIRLYYIEQFRDIPIRCLSEGIDNHADQKFVIYVNDRENLKRYLENKGIDVRIHYPQALSELPVSKRIPNKPDLLSTSVMLSRGVLSLPIYPELTDSEVQFIAAKVKEFYSKHK